MRVSTIKLFNYIIYREINELFVKNKQDLASTVEIIFLKILK